MINYPQNSTDPQKAASSALDLKQEAAALAFTKADALSDLPHVWRETTKRGGLEEVSEPSVHHRGLKSRVHLLLLFSEKWNKNKSKVRAFLISEQLTDK